jgi:transposase
MSKQKLKQQKTAALRRAGALNPHEQAVTDALFQHSDFFDPRDLVRRVRVERAPISHTALAFGLSRPSFYQAQAAFAARGLSGLLPQKPGPRGAHKLTAEVLEFLEKQLAQRPTLSGDELAVLLREKWQLVVHPRSIERGLQRHRKRQS